MHVLVTGHTGFKGAWLIMLLRTLGHEVSGIALDPEPGALFTTAKLHAELQQDLRLDIRDAPALRAACERIAPDAIIHMAAQPLVRRSYAEPRLTVETNVMGTLNLLQAAGAVTGLRALLVITTDKVYRNVNQVAGYREDDPLGGDDPYSASKAMADLLTTMWVRCYGTAPSAVARAGNVIGGGDVCQDRLLPDLVQAFAAGRVAAIRYPQAVRPWQHVLDCLSGYHVLLDALASGSGTGTWNFGPDAGSFQTVATVADLAAAEWGPDAAWAAESGVHPHEANLLALDASAATRDLGWRPVLGFTDAVAWTIQWYRAVEHGADPRNTSQQQIDTYLTGCRTGANAG
jgi:CDP-glucose 4,6-dehydratase